MLSHGRETNLTRGHIHTVTIIPRTSTNDNHPYTVSPHYTYWRCRADEFHSAIGTGAARVERREKVTNNINVGFEVRVGMCVIPLFGISCKGMISPPPS